MIHSFSSIRFFLIFLSPFLCSCAEVKTQILLCNDLHYLSAANAADLMKLLTEVGKMLYALIGMLKETNIKKVFGRKQ